ncbi:MAG TPA: hypothetical protein PKB07_22880 [Flavilitoribacter sp.]|nr:hypothetical protein [Flavilitoribacter sp.]
MRKIIIYFFYLILLSSSCQNSADTDIYTQVQEPAYSNVNFNYVQIEGLSKFYGFNTCVFDDFLFLYENTPYRRYHLVDLKKQRLIRTFGEKEGPFKLNQSYCNCQLIAKGDSLFTIIDDDTRDLMMFHLDDKDRVDQTTFSFERLEMPEGIISSDMVYLSKDQRRLFGFSAANASIFNYNISSKKTTFLRAGPDVKINADPITKANIFFAGTAASNTADLFGIAFSYFNLIQIYDGEFNLIKAISVGHPFMEIPRTEEGIPLETSTRYFGFMLFGKENIYIPFFNQPLNTIGNNTYLKVIILNLKNNTVKGIKIPKIISSLSVDSDEQFLYATLEDDSGESNLIRINLNYENE